MTRRILSIVAVLLACLLVGCGTRPNPAQAPPGDRDLGQGAKDERLGDQVTAKDTRAGATPDRTHQPKATDDTETLAAPPDKTSPSPETPPIP